MKTLLTLALAIATFASFAPHTLSAQQNAAIGGDYSGSLGPLHLKLHLKLAADGTLSGTLDSPDQGSVGLVCDSFKFNGKSLSFKVPKVEGSWRGTVSQDGATLSGDWTQGGPMVLTFKREVFVPAAKPSAVDGFWLGEIATGGGKLRLQVTVRSDAAGKEYCTVDSLDQHAMGIECGEVVFKNPAFSFEVPLVKGNWKGTLSADGKSLTGNWTQGSSIPLNFLRQAAALTAKAVEPPKLDPAMPPVTVAGMQAVLDADFAAALKSGELAPATGAGVTIGVVQHGERKIFSYGTAKTDSIFEIGSISKTFTGLILAQMVQQGKVKFDEPVRELLPPGTVAKPTGAEITLLDLATQHSGLPRMPDNFAPADKDNPYADYRSANLYAFLKKQGVAKPAKPEFLYSNLGVGLLGQALSDRAGIAYPLLLKQEVTTPLNLKDTVVTLSAEQESRFISGHDGEHKPAHAWDLDALAGAGAIRSTANDMLTYLEAQLHPDKVNASGPEGATLAAALDATHELRAESVPGMQIGLAWLYVNDSGTYWHNGATGGYSAYAFFNPKEDYAAVVLLNTSIGEKGSYADRIGEHILARLAGKPAISLAD
jgi:CubicO group peptidase (beta-lactamase class C family)